MNRQIRWNDVDIAIVQGDITQADVACIVNAANTSLLGGGGVDGAIHRAGGREILEACMKIRARQGGCPVGEAVITTAGRMRAEYVIHTVGPVWNGGENGEPEKLRNCYIRALELAAAHHIPSIAFPNISTGIYRYPQEQAAAVALNAVKAFVLQQPHALHTVSFYCFDDENARIYRSYLGV